MRIVVAEPPNAEAVYEKFPVRGAGVIFAWGDVIYNPRGVAIPPELIAHEQVHGAHQRVVGVEEWWRRYLEDDAFRLEEEILAHRVEFRVRLARYGDNRRNRRVLMARTAQRLASPVYQYRVSTRRALELLRENDAAALSVEKSA